MLGAQRRYAAAAAWSPVAKVTVDNFLGTNYELRVNYPSILAKGADDIFVHLEGPEGPIKFENVPGSKKRCGGQGDGPPAGWPDDEGRGRRSQRRLGRGGEDRAERGPERGRVTR